MVEPLVEWALILAYWKMQEKFSFVSCDDFEFALFELQIG
jgi:hypothetical protein